MLPLHPWQFGSILPWLDLFGIAVFAITGALAAAGRGQTFVTAAFFALITGVGGGSVRDLLIGRRRRKGAPAEHPPRRRHLPSDEG